MEVSLTVPVEKCKDLGELEDVVRKEVCKAGRELMRKALEEKDEGLMRSRGPGLRQVGKRKRTITTMLGDMTFERRLYRDERSGQCRFLLDEALNLPYRGSLSERVATFALSVAGDSAYRRTAKVLKQALPHGVSASAVQKQVWRFGARVEKAEAAKQEATFGKGEVPEKGQEAISRFFVEGDGVNVALQREKERRCEVKVGIGYTGWEAVGQDRHRVTGKVVHTGVEKPGAFWERFWLTAYERYDLSGLEYVVVNGDGANWIPEGLMGLPGVHQLDRFHLWESLREAFNFDDPSAGKIYQEATGGAWEGVERLIVEALSREGLSASQREAIGQVYGYLAANRDGLRDWRDRVASQPGDRSMGAMEGNIDKLIAIRAKRRGMSWRLPGIHSMAKLQQCLYEGNVGVYACASRPNTEKRAQPKKNVMQKSRGSATPFNAVLPALAGSAADRPLARTLRALINPQSIC
ncbi:MAG: ISLre2 family transposase [Chloroflexota bacterium]